ncbi:MAG: hypothetical protein A2508_08905 [Candidatus Lambdaproteobacteria bacterium RIFOXYD12_FULL_49_8]|uniref:Uncharacterized protein n=1 Tax=Candidatus Lambdaproteobacteria bacterium RIFOXYD2_FULL_50_16 TaxID=1817772 RepID=A0A1F6GBC6_9PROT|nr:MAG: hypothetical protein A2527_04755 [Candidatus Lambdaproteobacteria bacterium RIFOXYD2_FULL_50_16]OGG97670.1 MAG: hypothetical protein A2508_08905 [Candidatus Lambdaproteobacteria bacterium RIFOXYD12_FULL_49_8]
MIKGFLGKRSKAEGLVPQLIALGRRYEAKNLVSVLPLSDQKLKLLSGEFKAMYLVDYRQKPSGAGEVQTSVKLSKHLLNGKAERCFDLMPEEIGLVIQKLHTPAVIHLELVAGWQEQLALISTAQKRHAIIFETGPNAQALAKPELFKVAKQLLPHYYFDEEQERFVCHPA